MLQTRSKLVEALPKQSTLAETDTFGTGPDCLSQRGVPLIENQGNVAPVKTHAEPIRN